MPAEWNQEVVAPPQISSKWKQFEDGLQVAVIVESLGDGFVVRVIAESRTSGPNETVAGKRSNIEEAMKLEAGERLLWEAEGGGEIDLSRLRSI